MSELLETFFIREMREPRTRKMHSFLFSGLRRTIRVYRFKLMLKEKENSHISCRNVELKVIRYLERILEMINFVEEVELIFEFVLMNFIKR